MRWYKKFGWISVPVSIMGGLVDLVAIVLMIWIYSTLNMSQAPLKNLVLGFSVYFVCILVVRSWITSNTTEKDRF